MTVLTNITILHIFTVRVRFCLTRRNKNIVNYKIKSRKWSSSCGS